MPDRETAVSTRLLTERLRRALVMLEWAWILAALVHCHWLQRAVGAVPTTLWAVAIAFALEWTPRVPRLAGRALLMAVLVYRVSRFYRIDSSYWVERAVPTPSMLGRILLVMFVVGILYVWLLRICRFVETHPRSVGKAVLVAGTLATVLICADLLLVGQVPLARFDRLNYHPHLAYPIPGSYIYDHARERSVRDARGFEFQQKKPAGVTRIVLCGASTMHENIAETLREELLVRTSERRYEVITTAFPGKYQLNELIDVSVSVPHWQPDLVISINGFNEIWYGEKGTFYEGMPYIDVMMRAADPVSAVFARVSHLGAVLLTRRSFRPNGAILRDSAEYEPPRYYDYLRMTARSLASRNVPYVGIFCPTVLERDRPTESEREALGRDGAWKTQVAERRRRAAEIVQEEGQFPHDLMPALRDVEGPVFRDECHLTPLGIQIVCKDLADRIPGWIDQWQRRSANASE